MNDSWDDMRKAKEESYFAEQNKAALERLKSKVGEPTRLSPETGEPMVKETLMGVIIDKCPKTGGIYLDKGELEHLLSLSKKDDSKNILYSFFKDLTT